MKVIKGFEFEKLGDDMPIKIGDFISHDNGTNLTPIYNFEYINLFPENLIHMDLTVWRVTKAVEFVDNTIWKVTTNQ